MEQMEAWGPANVIYQPLIQQEVCRVHTAAWSICVTKLRAKGSEKPSGLRGLEQLWLQGHMESSCPMGWRQAELGNVDPFQDLNPSQHPLALPKQERPGNTGQTPQVLLWFHQVQLRSQSSREAAGLGQGSLWPEQPPALSKLLPKGQSSQKGP